MYSIFDFMMIRDFVLPFHENSSVDDYMHLWISKTRQKINMFHRLCTLHHFLLKKKLPNKVLLWNEIIRAYVHVISDKLTYWFIRDRDIFSSPKNLQVFAKSRQRRKVYFILNLFWV